MTLHMFIEFFFIPYLINISNKNILVYAYNEDNEIRVLCRRKVKAGFKSIIFNETLLNKLFQEYINNKDDNRFVRTENLFYYVK